jgi:hypothetical protein
VKGCLAIIAFCVVGAAVLVGVAITVERHGASKNEPLTELTTEVEYTAYEPETHRSGSRTGGTTVPGANIEYRYRADDRWFVSPSPIWLPRSRLELRTVCFDPDDPALHVIRGSAYYDCGEGNIGAVRRAKEAP